MKTERLQTRSGDLSSLRLRRHFLLFVFAYLPPFPNGLRGFPGLKETLWIWISHATPTAVHRWMIQHEARLHSVFRWLRNRNLF